MRNSHKTYNILLWKNKIWESRVSNTGDLAIILNTVLKIKEQIPNTKIYMFSDDPEYVERRYGICAYPIRQVFNPIKLYRILKKMDLVILGGGTIIQDNYFIGVIPVNLSIGLIAKLLGKKVACNSIGVASEDEITFVGKMLSTFALKRFDSITVRDKESEELLDKWTHGRVPVTVTHDIAVDLPAADFEHLRPLLEEKGIDLDKNDTVAIVARKIFHHEKSFFYFMPSSLRTRLGLVHPLYKKRIYEFKKCLAKFCDYIIEQYDVNVVFIPFYASGGSVDTGNYKTPRRFFTSRGREFAKKIHRLIKHKRNVKILQRTYKPEEIVAIISKCKALIGVPYHSIVFASSQNVPVVGINYVSKVGRYMKMLGLEDYLIPAKIRDGVSLEILKQKFDQLWQNKEQISRQLETKNRQLRELSSTNIRILKDLLQAT